MDIHANDCCCAPNHEKDCILCGKPLVYFPAAKVMTCAVCGKEKAANAACEDGHFVCDECHTADGAAIFHSLRGNVEKDPIRLFMDVCALPCVHVHGPEHHGIVPCVLVTAYRNNGGEIEYEDCLQEAWTRGKKIPGGACGFLGVCGAAAGAGIFASILCEATPLTAEVWDVPQRVTMEALRRMTEIGGPRCCKRTGRIALETAADFVEQRYGIRMPVSKEKCIYSDKNRECLHEKCPYFPG